MAGQPDPDRLRERLRPMRPPLVPEIVIHAAFSGSGLARMTTKPPYWAFPWPGGCLLARYLLDNPGIAAGRRALDLGAGCGIVAIAAAKAGAIATAVDLDPLAGAAITANAGMNGVDVAVRTADALRGAPPETDLVLVGDLFYQERLAKRVTRFLDRCHAAGIDILVGDIGRPGLPRERLNPLAAWDVTDFGVAQTRCGEVFAWVAAA